MGGRECDGLATQIKLHQCKSMQEEKISGDMLGKMFLQSKNLAVLSTNLKSLFEPVLNHKSTKHTNYHTITL